MYATFYYSKNTGKIKSYCITEVPQDMGYFGDDRVDYELIYDYLVLEYNEEIDFIIKNRNYYIIDVEAKQLKMKNENIDLTKYQ